MKITEEKYQELENLIKPLQQWLNDNLHPQRGDQVDGSRGEENSDSGWLAGWCALRNRQYEQQDKIERYRKAIKSNAKVTHADETR